MSVKSSFAGGGMYLNRDGGMLRIGVPDPSLVGRLPRGDLLVSILADACLKAESPSVKSDPPVSVRGQSGLFGTNRSGLVSLGHILSTLAIQS